MSPEGGLALMLAWTIGFFLLAATINIWALAYVIVSLLLVVALSSK